MAEMMILDRREGREPQLKRLQFGRPVLDDTAVEDILCLLKQCGIVPPDNFDRARFTEDLNYCEPIMWGSACLFSVSRRRKRYKNMTEMHKLATRLEALLDIEKDSLVIHFDGVEDDNNFSNFQRLITAISKLAKKGEHDARLLSTPMDNVGGSLFERFVAHLAGLYEEHFGKRATIIRDPKPRGPFLEFASTLLKTFDIKTDGRYYSDESVAKALSKQRRLRLRHD